jgi:thiol-disulfide isomerase/thioredoxin
MKTRVVMATLLMAGLASLAISQEPTATAKLKVGLKAPAISVAKWAKGTPVKSFEKGKVYVVEYWATWCGPCKVSIPHLTEMAKKYAGKATFIGVSVWESDPKDFNHVTDFVKEMGDKMNYTVAIDGPDAVMAKNWMAAAGQNGIPTAFVVDKTGSIAWIGHPMAGLDEVVGKVIDGTFDVKAEAAKAEAMAAKQAAEAAKQAEVMAIAKPITEALQAKKYAEAVVEIDKAIAAHPDMESQFAMTKFMVLSKTDEAAACTYAKKIGEGVYKDDSLALNQIAWTIVDEKTGMKAGDAKIAIAIALRASELTKNEDAMILDTVAYAYYKAGNLDKAIEFQTLSVKFLDKSTQADDATKKEITDRLAMYKAKKAAGGNLATAFGC